MSQRYEFRLLTWVDASVSAPIFTHRFDMNKTIVSGFTKSELTFQNATPNAVGTNSTDVNNANPLSVTPYYGSGNGTYWAVKTNTTASYQSFIADPVNQQITVVSAEATNSSLQEPPTGKFFLHSKSGKKFILQPGAIHKSVCYTPVKMSIARYLNMHVGNSATIKYRLGFGCHKFFGCEKVVTSTLDSGFESDVKIVVDMELDNAYNLTTKLGKRFTSVPANFKRQLAIKG